MFNATFQNDLFKHRTALVTGGTSGLGAATAVSLAELGAKVYAAGLKADLLEVPDGLDITPVELNLLEEETVRKFVAGLDSLDILYNGAGGGNKGELELEGFVKTINLNLNTVLHVSSLTRPLLAKSEIGSIVNVASMTSFFGSGSGPGYSASKGGVAQLTKSLANAYAKDGIRVNAVAPGWIDTPIMAGLKANEVLLKKILDRTPLGRLGKPAEIGQVVAFLCSPAAYWINGAVLPVDGGYLTVDI